MKTRCTLTLVWALSASGTVWACAGGEPAGEVVEEQTADRRAHAPPPILATNAFYYYDDVDAAWAFYTDVLGFRTVVDYGFAKILHVAPTSYLTLVDAERGMHSADEPRSVTLALVTEEVEGWWDYLSSREIPMRADFEPTAGQPHDGFVAVDPEGYFLEFERFNEHPENERLTPVLAAAEPMHSAVPSSPRPRDLGIQATVLWLYYADIPAVQDFYEDAMGLEMIVDQGWAKVYPTSRTGFIGFVDGERGLHSATEEKSVTVSFFTDDVDAWFDYVRDAPGFELRTPEITDESGRVRVFVGYDPEGYFLEWDTFLDVDGNRELLALMRRTG